MNICVKFVVHGFINLIKVKMEFKDDEDAMLVAQGLKNAGFPVTLVRETIDIKSEVMEIK